jgi:thiamine kinase-like enzyme
MRLTQKNITFYLLDKGFLHPDYFLSGDYTLSPQMSRNSIFKIQHQKDNGLFVKQLVQQDHTNRYLMQKDATSHYLIHQSNLYKETAQYIPKYYGYDPNHHILITEYFQNTKSIHEEVFRTKTISEAHAKKMAEILASFHFDIRDEINSDESLQFYSGDLPWILKMGNLSNTNGRGGNNGVVTEIQKNPNLVKKIENIAAQWETYSLIHGDVKWINFIVTEDGKDVKLIDWEIADLGDPLWDVAGALQSYFSSWILSFDNRYKEYIKTPNTEFLTIEIMLPIIKIFWDTYAKLKKYSKADKKQKLLKTLKYTAARMIQTAFENNTSQNQIKNNSLKMIQFCDNLLTNTEQVANDWKLLS